MHCAGPAPRHGGALRGDGAGGASGLCPRRSRGRAGLGRARVRAGPQPAGRAVPALRLPGAAARRRHLRPPRAPPARHEEEGGGGGGGRRRGRAAGALAGARHVLLRERGLHPRRGQRQVPGVRRLRGGAHRLALPGRQGQLLRGAGARGPRVTPARVGAGPGPREPPEPRGAGQPWTDRGRAPPSAARPPRGLAGRSLPAPRVTDPRLHCRPLSQIHS